MGLKNDLEQIPELKNDFDFAVVEQCFEYDECDLVKPFIAAGKPVFEVEYSGSSSSFCPAARKLRINSVKARLDLDAPSTPCP